jgi:PKD repeat protein
VIYSVSPIANATGYSWTYSGTGATNSNGSTNNITLSFATTATSGNLTVIGTNSCGNGTISANYPVTVNPLPADAGMITGPAAVCQGQSGVIYSVSPIANATGYNWTIPTGATITSGANTNLITVNFSATAIGGTITVQGTNGCGTGMISPSFTVTITPPPMAFAGPDATICEGSAYTISGAMASNYSSLLWTTSGTGTLINGATLSPTYIHSPADVAAGSVTLVLTATGITPCAAAASDEMVLTINPLPAAAGIIIGSTSVCQGQDGVSYSVPSIPNATSYVWVYSGTGATISQGTTNNISINFASNATSGNLTVMGVNSCGNGLVSSPFPVNVNLHPMANYTFSNNPILGEPVQFTDLSQTSGGGAIISWLWNFGDPSSGVNNTSTSQNPLHAFNTMGTHTVTLVVLNTSGCLDTLMQMLTVSLPPNAAPFTYAGSLGAGSGYPVLVPITVTGFDNITAISLRVDYNPNVMTFDSSANRHVGFSQMMVNDTHVSDTLHKVMISWVYISPVSLPNDSKLVDLAFSFISGTTAVIFNNESNGGLDCEYTDANGNPMIDIPTSVYYTNGAVHEGLDLTGAFRYDNPASTALDSLWVILKQNGVKVDSTRANIIGRFDFFNIPSNTYTLWAHSAKPWGGVNSTDALKIQLHFSGLELLSTPVRLLAADVNNSDNINLADAIKVQRRFIGADTAFARGDWTFAKPTGGDTVIVAGANVVQDIQGLCVGDVDGSHIPLPGHKPLEGVFLLAESMIEVRQGAEFDLPVKIAMDGQIGAISLVLDYPVEELEPINITIVRGDVMYTARNGQIRIAWSQIEPMNLAYGDVLLTLKFKLSEAAPLGVPLILDIGQESELADGWGERIAHSIISIPTVVPVKSTGIHEKSNLITKIMLYPNPTTGKAFLAFELLMDASIEVEGYNMVGELVKTIRFDGLSMGKHKKELDVSELATGVYTLKTTVRGRSTSTVYHKLVITK